MKSNAISILILIILLSNLGVQMDYQAIYEQLIQKAVNRERPEGYLERHHIKPKSLGGSNESSNIVPLTAREHFIAHLLLAKIYGGPDDNSSLHAIKEN